MSTSIRNYSEGTEANLAYLEQSSKCTVSFLEISESTSDSCSDVESNMKDPDNPKYAEVWAIDAWICQLLYFMFIACLIYKCMFYVTWIFVELSNFWNQNKICW